MLLSLRKNGQEESRLLNLRRLRSSRHVHNHQVNGTDSGRNSAELDPGDPSSTKIDVKERGPTSPPICLSMSVYIYLCLYIYIYLSTYLSISIYVYLYLYVGSNTSWWVCLGQKSQKKIPQFCSKERPQIDTHPKAGRFCLFLPLILHIPLSFDILRPKMTHQTGL